MKKELTFIDKLRIFIKWMRQHKDYGLIATCSLCQSTRLRRVSFEEDRLNEVASYVVIYECMDCRATGKATEDWEVKTK